MNRLGFLPGTFEQHVGSIDLKWQRTAKQFEEDDSHGEDVGANICFLAQRLFRCHVGRSANEHTSSGTEGLSLHGGHVATRKPRGPYLRGLSQMGNAKIHHHNPVLRVAHDVGRFEVAVDDALCMRGLKSAEDLPDDVASFNRGEFAFAQ